MRFRKLPFVSIRFLVLSMLVSAGLLSGGHTARSSGPDDPGSRLAVAEKFDGGGRGPAVPARISGKEKSKVDSAIGDVMAARRVSGPSAAIEKAGTVGLKSKDDSVLVVVEGVHGSGEKLRGILESRGASSASANADMVQAFLPVGEIENIASMPEVTRVRRPYVPVVDYASEGLGVINAPTWQSIGRDGTGVKIGIIDAGFLNYSLLLGSELPPADRIHVQSFYPGGDITGGGERHGTACAEIIYDIAPAANYYLANIYSDVDFGSAVDWMIANGVNVVSVSLGWAGTNNYDGTGFLASKVNAARSAGIFWANSAGNFAQRHWEGWFSDTDGNGAHNFAYNDEGNTIYATAGSAIFGALTWNDSWSNPASDYDLYLVRSSNGQTVAAGGNYQGPGVPPSETVVWNVDQTDNYFFALVKYIDSGPSRYLELYGYAQNFQYQVASSSLTAPADATGAVAVGAFNWSGGTIESFSSQGPTNDGRMKPELTAPDGVSTYSYAGSGYGPFLGTSASAPHVAGAAAVVKQAYPSYSPAQIQSFLEGKAIDAGTLGKDNIYGAGKLNLGMPSPRLAVGNTSIVFLTDPIETPGAQQVSIGNSGGGLLTWTAQEWQAGAAHDYPWLVLSAGSGTAPSTLQVTVDKTQVVSGTAATAQIRLDGTSPSAESTPQYVDVTLVYSSQPLSKLYLPVVSRSYTGSW